MKNLLVISGIILLLSNCRKTNSTVDLGYTYFPNSVGHYCIYEVDSTIFRDFYQDTVHSKWQQKELIHSYFTDNEGRQTMRVEQYTRKYCDSIPIENVSWVLYRVISFTRTGTTAERVENNQRFISLSFTPRIGKKWNGNAFNTIGEWDYKYVDVDVPYSLDSGNFDSTLLVQQKLDTNRLSYRAYTERYARHVGLIERNVIDVESTSLCCGSVLTRINNGVMVTIKLLSWGDQ
jgi:hypothetical protein